MKVALYSAIYGGYEVTAKPLPADLDVPAVLYTDNPEITAPGWEVRVVTDHISDQVGADRSTAWPDPKATWAMMAHKYWKCHPHEALSDVDVSLWVDGSIQITVDRYVQRCLDALGDDDWVAVRHPWRGCIYTEAEYSGTLPRYDAVTVMQQAQFYRSIGHPAAWGLFATGANVRRHYRDGAPTRAADRIGEQWWHECVTRTHQDQVSLPVLFRLAEDKLKWNTNMPWHEWWFLHQHGA